FSACEESMNSTSPACSSSNFSTGTSWTTLSTSSKPSRVPRNPRSASYGYGSMQVIESGRPSSAFFAAARLA
ncbi:MAG: hypothetical protein ACJ72D_25455, partial [Marmoricola sp.]